MNTLKGTLLIAFSQGLVIFSWKEQQIVTAAYTTSLLLCMRVMPASEL